MRTMGREGMVASPHYLATGAGLNVLRRGGSAVDAAIATNAVLAVVQPYVCGIGGDLFALVRTPDGELAGLNGSGRAPKAATPSRMRELTGGAPIPQRGPLPITVPGCVEAWGALHDRYGRLPLTEVLADSIRYAQDGFPVTAHFAASIEASASVLHPDTPAVETFLPGGKPPREGHVLRQHRIARTLQAIAEDGPQVYYHGWIAEELVRAVQGVGGILTQEDLAAHHSDWVEPLSVRYRDVTVYELPPNTQGVIALSILNILNNLPQEELRAENDRYVHSLAEAARHAYQDRPRLVTDPAFVAIDPREILTEEYGRERAQRIGDRASARTLTGTPGDTIYLCTADRDGMLVSLIESNWMGIGSGVMGGETGVMLQNRGNWFSLDPDHANVIAPEKRTMHTLIPAMAFRDEKPWLVFGTMGGSQQAQIHVEVLTRLVDQGLPLDEAIEAPRFDAVSGTDDDELPVIAAEGRFSAETLEGLRRRGHAVRELPGFTSAMGHAHAIAIEGDGVYVGAADPRSDSLALGY